MRTPETYLRFTISKIRKATDKHFVLVLSIFIGIVAGLNAFFLKTGVYFLQKFLLPTTGFGFSYFWLLVLPAIGILLTLIFTKFVIKDNEKHGISSILYSISRKKSEMKRHKMFSSVTGALLTAGFGGSVGLESPIISSGSAIGSNIGRYLKLNYKTVTLLLACGASGAIAAIYNTPVTAVVFALEVLLLDLTRFSLIPLLSASISGALVTKIFFNPAIPYSIEIDDSFSAIDVPFFILLGIITGFISLYFSKIYLKVEKYFESIKQEYKKILLGSVLLGILIFLFPPLFGEGSSSIKHLLNGSFDLLYKNSPMYGFSGYGFVLIIFFLLLILLKVVATSVTVGSGGIGGIFAPSLFTGAVTGFLFVYCIDLLDTGIELSPENYILVAMASTLCGVLHAPLTATFLIPEITGGYELFVPLMVANTISFLTVKTFSLDSIFTVELSKVGNLITHHKDKAVLTLLELSSVIETNFTVVNINSSLGELVKIVSVSKRNIFPVTDNQNYFFGVVLLDNIREIMFDTKSYNTVFINELMNIPRAVISVKDNMDTVIEKFKTSEAWNLPVLDDEKYVGFVSKSKIFEEYRKLLVELSDD